MSMSDSSFEFILEALRMQKQRLEELQAENSELRHQLTELRNGQGIIVDILGTRFTLVGTQPLEQLAQEMVQETPTMEFVATSTVDTPTTAMPFIPETPRPHEFLDELLPPQEQVTDEISPTFSSSLLDDEGFDDDFANSVTSPVSVWKAPEDKPQAKPINEDEKAALRRELIGSFLLE